MAWKKEKETKHKVEFVNDVSADLIEVWYNESAGYWAVDLNGNNIMAIKRRTSDAINFAKKWMLKHPKGWKGH